MHMPADLCRMPTRVRTERHCGGCGAECPPAARFCPSCGQPVDRERAVSLCRECGHSVQPDQAFCIGCGAPQTEPDSASVSMGATSGDAQTV